MRIVLNKHGGVGMGTTHLESVPLPSLVIDRAPSLSYARENIAQHNRNPPLHPSPLIVRFSLGQVGPPEVLT